MTKPEELSFLNLGEPVDVSALEGDGWKVTGPSTETLEIAATIQAYEEGDGATMHEQRGYVLECLKELQRRRNLDDGASAALEADGGGDV